MIGKRRGLALERVSALLVLAVVLSPAPARADEEKAKEAYKEGVELAKEGEFEEAIEKFEEAQNLGAPDEVLFNLGKCHENLGEYHIAVEYYEEYLASPSAKKKSKIKKKVDELKIKPSVVTFGSEPSGAEVKQVLEDDTHEKLGVTPFEQTFEVGTFTFIVVKDGYEEEEVTIEAGSGKPFDLEIELEPSDEKAAAAGKAKKPPEEDEPGKARPAGKFPVIGLAAEVGGGAALYPYKHVGFQGGGIISFGASYRFSHGVESGFGVGMQFDFRSYNLTGEGHDLISFMCHILAVPTYQLKVHRKLAVQASVPLGFVILSPTKKPPGDRWIDLVDGYIEGGNLALFDIGFGVALKIALASAWYLTVEPVRLHVLIPMKKWRNTKALADLDIVVRAGFEF